MKQKDYNKLSGTVFAIVAAVHLVRILAGWEAIIGGFVVPVWLSAIAVVLTGFLSYSAFKLGK